jgi:hypothetical protein
MNISLKLRLYPSCDQIQKINQHLGAVRFIYNHALELRQNVYKTSGEMVHRFDINKNIQGLKHSSHYKWLKDVPCIIIGCSKLDILAKGLYDESHAVRWATAYVLADLGSVAVPSILKALTTHPINEPFRQAAYHALHSMRPKALQEELKPLLDALHALGADIEAPMVAEKMLENWENDKMD